MLQLLLIVEIFDHLWLVVLVNHMIGLTIIVVSLESICGVVLSDGPFVGSHFGAFPRDLLIEKTDELLLLHDDVLD